MSGKSGNYFALLDDAEPAAQAKVEKPATTQAAAKAGRPAAAPTKAGGHAAAKAGPRVDARSGHEKTREVKDRERKGPFKGRGRQFDKQSHSGTKQGAKTEKREGAGKANWGTQQDDLIAQTTPVAAEGEEAPTKDAAAADAAPVPTEEDEDAKLVSYDDFLKKGKVANEIRATPARKAGEGVENKEWEKFVAVSKKDEDAPVFIGAPEEKKEEKKDLAAAQPKAGGKKKKAEPVDPALLAGLRVADHSRPARDGPRPPRGDRPPRADGDRPRRPREDRPPRDEKAPRDEKPRGDRPPRAPRDDKAPREDRPPRAQGDRAPRAAAAAAKAPRAGPKAQAAPKGAPKAGGLFEDPSAFPALS